MLEVYYDPRMVADSEGYSPSGSKPELVVRDWADHGLPFVIHTFEPLDRDSLALAHRRSYVDGVMDLEISNGHGNCLRSVANTLPWTNGSHYAAARRALEVGVACSPTSGFHHAHWDSGHGFCTFNGLMITAERLFREQLASRVAIWDLDYHWPDGCEDIAEKLRRQGDLIILSNSYADSSQVIFDEMARHTMELNEFRPDLVMYQAGADMFIEDPLGGAMTIEELGVRDDMVFEWCLSHHVPVVWNLAGGYTRDSKGGIPKVLEIHRNTLKSSMLMLAQCAQD